MYDFSYLNQVRQSQNAMGPQMGPTQFGAPLQPQMQSPQLNAMQQGMLNSPGMGGATPQGPAAGMNLAGMGMMNKGQSYSQTPYQDMAQDGLDRMQNLALLARQRMGY